MDRIKNIHKNCENCKIHTTQITTKNLITINQKLRNKRIHVNYTNTNIINKHEHVISKSSKTQNNSFSTIMIMIIINK